MLAPAQKFIELVEGLLDEHLRMLGLSADDFGMICEAAGSGLTKRALNAQVVDALLAAEDFASFKSMMVARNLELERKAIKHARDDV